MDRWLPVRHARPVRDLQQGPVDRARPPSCRGIASPGTRAAVDHDGAAFDEHAPLVAELLDRIRREGPLASTDIEPRAAIEWYWRPTNQIRAILEALAEAGILGLARRDGNRRVYDLAERLFPAPLLAGRPAAREQRRHKLLSRYRAHGLLGRSGSARAVVRHPAGPDSARPERRRSSWPSSSRTGRSSPVTRRGRPRRRGSCCPRRSACSTAPEPGGPPGVAFLAPLDPFVWDRDFLRALYDFDYVWEVYVPAARRRWGYYVLPILFGDRLVGRIEPRFDRRAGTLRVLDLWWEDGFDPLVAEPASSRR